MILQSQFAGSIALLHALLPAFGMRLRIRNAECFVNSNATTAASDLPVDII
jgi:hypothetical protein